MQIKWYTVNPGEVQRLLADGVNVNVSDQNNGNTPLIRAALKGDNYSFLEFDIYF